MPNFFFLFLSEVFVFWSLVNLYGFSEVALWYWAPTAVALLFLIFFGRSMILRAQANLGQGAAFSLASLHSMTIVVGILFLLMPFISARVLAIILITPGLRHLILWKFRDFVAQKIKTGFQNQQTGNFRFYYGGWNSQSSSTAENRERDVNPRSLPASEEIIDVTPISPNEPKDP